MINTMNNNNHNLNIINKNNKLKPQMINIDLQGEFIIIEEKKIKI